MKILGWLITIFSEIFAIGFFIAVPWLIMDQSYWWAIVPAIVIILGDFIWAFLWMWIHYKKRDNMKDKMDVKEAIKFIKNEIKTDEDNPDNFILQKQRLLKIGGRNTEKTRVLCLYGHGTETDTDRFAIMNLDNQYKEITYLIDALPEEIAIACIDISDTKPDDMVKEEIITALDNFGRPVTTQKRSSPSPSEERKAKEEKQEDEKSGM